jgi:predicted RNase H-like HicB family nuclease
VPIKKFIAMCFQKLNLLQNSGAIVEFPNEGFEGDWGGNIIKKLYCFDFCWFSANFYLVLLVTALNTHRLNVILIKMEGKSLNYTVLIEQDEDGIYIAKVPDIPGCYTQGKTVEQAMERIREAIQVCLEAEELEDVLPLKFIGIQQVEVKV